MKTLFVLISFLSINAFADYRGHDQDINTITQDSTIQKIFNKEDGNEIIEITHVDGRLFNVQSLYCTAVVEVKTECRSTVPRHNELDICENKVEVKSLLCKFND